jgi:hypothetical protein
MKSKLLVLGCLILEKKIAAKIKRCRVSTLRRLRDPMNQDHRFGCWFGRWCLSGICPRSSRMLFRSPRRWGFQELRSVRRWWMFWSCFGCCMHRALTPRIGSIVTDRFVSIECLALIRFSGELWLQLPFHLLRGYLHLILEVLRIHMGTLEVGNRLLIVVVEQYRIP